MGTEHGERMLAMPGEDGTGEQTAVDLGLCRTPGLERLCAWSPAAGLAIIRGLMGEERGGAWLWGEEPAYIMAAG